MNNRQSLCRLLIASFALASTTHAASKSGSFAYSVGNSNIGASLNFSASASNSSTSAGVALGTNGGVKLLGKSGNLVSFSASDTLVNKVPTGSVTLAVAGFTVYSKTVSASASWSTSVSQTFLTASTVVTVPVGPIPVPLTLTASLGGGANLNLAAQLNVNAKTPAASTVGLSGSASTSVNGSASAALGLKQIATAGVIANMQFATTTLSSTANVGLSTMTGGVTLSFTPVNIVFTLFVNALNGSLKLYNNNFYTFSANSFTNKLLSLP